MLQEAAAEIPEAEHDNDALRLVMRRRQDKVRAYFDAQLQRFASDGAAAEKLMHNGVSPIPPGADLVRLAALTNLTAVIMNTPDAYTLR